jgi:uncharacterized protein (TIGR00369 family)
MGEAVPEGFRPHDRKSAVTDAWEPLYSSYGAEAVRLGFFLDARHCNGRGLLHGGVIAALADNAMGLTLGTAMRAAGGETLKGLVTTTLSVDYIGVAKLGQWIEVSPRVVKAGGSSGVVDALVTADGEVIARANANFRVMR